MSGLDPRVRPPEGCDTAGLGGGVSSHGSCGTPASSRGPPLESIYVSPPRQRYR